MNTEFFINLPEGKTIIPAQLIINKMGSSIVLDVKAQLRLEKILTDDKNSGMIDPDKIE